MPMQSGLGLDPSFLHGEISLLPLLPARFSPWASQELNSNVQAVCPGGLRFWPEPKLSSLPLTSSWFLSQTWSVRGCLRFASAAES